jgi:hypothetical protein
MKIRPGSLERGPPKKSTPKIKKMRFLLNLLVTASRRAEPPAITSVARTQSISFQGTELGPSQLLVFPTVKDSQKINDSGTGFGLGKAPCQVLSTLLFRNSSWLYPTIYHQKSER